MIRRVCIALVLSVALSAPAFAGMDLINGADERSEVTIGSFVPNADGNQSRVREFDGRHFTMLGIEKLESIGYDGPFQYALEGRDLTLGDEDILFGLAYRNTFGIRFSTSAMLHRFSSIPVDNPALVGTAAAGGDHLLDLGFPNQDYSIDRRVTDIGLRATPALLRGTRFVAGWWEETEDGTRQIMFRAREAKPGVIANRTKGLAPLPVDRDTNEGTVGADIPIGNSTVVNYRFSNTKFAEDGGKATPGTNEDFLPLNKLTQPKSDTSSTVIKARSQITSKLHFTGVHTNKTRENRSSALQAPTGADIGSTNLALTYLATDTLTLTGRYRTFNYDNTTGPVIVSGSQTNAPLSTNTKSVELDSTFSGIPRTFLKLDFEKRETDRDPLAGDEIPLIRPSSKSSIVRAGFRYYPTVRFSLSSNLESWNTDNAGYTGVPDKRNKVAMNATYMLRDDVALYGDFNKLDERNHNNLVPLASIPTPATNAAGQVLREQAAGQDYGNTVSTLTLGTWYAVTSKLTFDANYAKINMDSAALWIFGNDPASVPHLLPDYVPFKSHNNQLSLGATYAFTSRFRMHGQVANSFSVGSSLIDPAKYPGNLGPVWTPFDVNERTFTVGCAYDVTPKDCVSLDLSASNWKDNTNAGNDGRFALAQLAWARSF